MLADTPDAALPTLVDMTPGEALDGYLERVADANHLSTAHLVQQVRAGSDTTAYLMLAPTSATLDRLAHLTGVDAHHLRHATLAAYDGTSLDLEGLDPTRQSSFRTVSARGWIPGHGTQICPGCLADDGIWRTTWRLPTTTVCRTHGTYLVATCPGCGRPFRDQRHSPLRVVGAQPRCGNPLGQGPRKQCQIDLTTLVAEIADPACIARQQRQDAADFGATTATFDGPVGPREYSATVRSLTALLLHLSAAARNTTTLPRWAHNHHATPTSGVRRWTIRPPHNPAIRSRALTTADQILNTERLDAAVDRFTPWLEHVPDVPEGRLGWLADHTRMTPTLTRLVMAAHAPRRRLSQLLDQSAPLTPSTRQIPQVLPDHLVRTHLATLFDSRPATVGLFAALCLARSHQHVHSWADAARALGLAPDLGERTARACSASLTGSPRDVHAALFTAAQELHVDYRDLENRIHHLGRTTRWFTRWARNHRPGTRASSHRYAVTWLWLEAAHGHVTSAPLSATPWNFQKFARSVTAAQTQTLTEVIATTSHKSEEHRWARDPPTRCLCSMASSAGQACHRHLDRYARARERTRT
ncbi:MAG: TniQ family protein [Nocardioides sp.]